MGHRDGILLAGQTWAIMALIDSSQFGILFVTLGEKLLVTSLKKTSVFLLTPQPLLLRLGGDELKDASGGRRQLTMATLL